MYQNGNLDLASFDKNGNSYAEPVFPFELEFVPNRNVLKWTDSSSRWYKQLVENSQDIRKGDVLFTVRARAVNWDGTLQQSWHKIGFIK